MKKFKIVIVGGGFAGLQAARSLRRLRNADMRLIDRTGIATMVPALPDTLSGRLPSEKLFRPLREVADGSLDVVVDTVESVSLAHRTVTCTDGTYAYDGLVLAGGSVPVAVPPPFEGPVHSVDSLEGAGALRAEIEARVGRDPLHLVVAGAGYTGLEVAAAARRGVPDPKALAITVVDTAQDILPMLTDRQRSAVRAYLEKSSITLCTSTSVRRTTGSVVELSNGATIGNAVFVWSAGMRAAPIELDEQVERTPDGRILTTDTLALPGHPEVFVAGDQAALTRDDRVLRRAVNFAFYSGRRAGRNLARRLNNRHPRRFVPVDLGWVLPLIETSAGSIFGGLRIGGRLGLRLHYLMCGFRHFGGRRAGTFYRAALNLRRTPAPLSSAAPPGGRHGNRS